MQNTPTRRISHRLPLAILCALTLNACNPQDGKKPATQAAVKVNGEEISVHQINSVLGRIPNLGTEQVESARSQVVEKLIDQQLAVQQAMERKLDRTPEVVLAIENAKREIIAKAYLEHLAASIAKPGEADIRKYYDEHPELFNRRNIYSLQEILVAPDKVSLPQLQERANTQTMEQLAEWLQAGNIPHRVDNSTRAAEQIPLEILPRLAKLQNGDTMIVNSPQAIAILHLVESRPAPQEFPQAKDAIAIFLANQRNSETVKNELGQLRQKSKIEYLGDFAKNHATTPVTTEPITPQAGAVQLPEKVVQKAVTNLK